MRTARIDLRPLFVCLFWCAVLVLAVPVAVPVPAGGGPPQGYWVITGGQAAPWVTETDLDDTLLIGTIVEFGVDGVHSASELGCRQARYETRSVPAEGLFQGNLPAPAEASASRLGFERFPVESVLVTCSTGVFLYHMLKTGAMLVALDNVIWTLNPKVSNP